MIVPEVMWGLVLFHFLDRALVLLEILDRGEALHGLGREIAVGHRVADGHDLLAHVLEDLRHAPGCLRFAATGADRADRDHRLGALDHAFIYGRFVELRTGVLDQFPLGVDVVVVHVAVSEDHLVDLVFLDQVDEIFLGLDLDTVGISWSGQDCGVLAIVDAGDLRGGEADYLYVFAATVNRVEDVEVLARGSHDENAMSHCAPRWSRGEGRPTLTVGDRSRSLWVSPGGARDLRTGAV